MCPKQADPTSTATPFSVIAIFSCGFDFDFRSQLGERGKSNTGDGREENRLCDNDQDIQRSGYTTIRVRAIRIYHDQGKSDQDISRSRIYNDQDIQRSG